MWMGSSEGTFSTKLAWEAIRQDSPQRRLLTDVWHRSLRPTILVFLWRLFQDRILVDARMQKKGFNFPSKRQCCAAEETISHLFVESTAVQGVWQHFATLFGSCLCDMGSLTYMVHFLRYSTLFYSDLHIRTLIPFLILWFTWMQQNAAKYRKVQFSTDDIILEVQRHLRTLDQCDCRAQCRLVGLELVLAHGLAPLVVEMDTIVVIQLLQSRVSGKWEVQHLIMHIVHIQQLLVADIQHVFKEANGAADHLVKEVASLQMTRVLRHDDIIGLLSGILCLDRRGVPHLRPGR
ncbi:UNVERIFIED_CONTAM: hypothetical protein Sradi_0868800 [Sesamum radiatum]|uniref:Reverse transcriptase zinc-binding domain-containing protein n=1 Tax=Sesamum radiatum TaxID=300843 RepID=A0AAW2V0S4_SESRA